MTRPATAALDAKILSLLEQDWIPKEVKRSLGLKNTMRVYNAIRRRKINLQKIVRDKP